METKMTTQQEVNVRVAVRVRPLLPKERVSGEEMCMRVVPSSNQLILGKDRGFTFDYVHSPKVSQEEVYKSCVESLVGSIFEGYNATVFAYGQTGSGKTYTVGGGNMNALTEEEYGIIPRALKDMFDYMQANKEVEYSVKVSYIEIYKEELQDLLDIETPASNLHVREDDKGNTVIIGAREVECETLDDVMSLLESGSAVRTTGSTQMNEHSSRSHSVFTVNIGQKWTENDVMAEKRKQSESTESLDEDITHTMCGKFHFVDLAGSERAHRTGNVGDRFKESVHINSGLLALGNVISSLGDPKKRSTHIPYRESKITRLLKDSLGGNAKTLMICCISPSSANFDESHNALKYANRARNIKNTPIVNRDVQSIRFEEMQCEIKALREELVRQRTSMLSNGGGDNVYNPEKAMQDAQEMKKLEQQVIRLQTECSHYKMIAEEAYRQLIEIQQRDILSKSQDFRLKDWLDLMEEIKNKVPATLTKEELENQTIRDLQSQLKKCREDLKSDEEIFAEKNKDFNGLIERNEELGNLLEETTKKLSEAENQIRKQEQQMIEQQMKIEELHKALKDELFSESSILDEEAVASSAPAGMTGGQRPKSVPVQLSRRPDAYPGLRPPSRNIKTSPALFTLERVMKSFRARSQLLVSRLEDSDEVMHQTFDEDEENIAIGNSLGDGSKFKRKGTYKVKKGPGNSEDNKENNADQMNIPAIRISKPAIRGSVSSSAGDPVYETVEDRLRKSINTQRKIKETQIKMSEDHQKMRDLSINIRMKEQLIKELVKTGKDAEVLNKQYAEKIKHLEKEKEKTKSDLEETHKLLTELETNKHQEKVEKQRLQQEYKKKLELSKAKMSAIQRKQKETEKIANFSAQNSKKISDLEMQVDRMRQQQDQLQKRLKDESEKKGKLEKEMQKEAQKVRDLQKKNEHQEKLLKKKNEEIAAAQRKLKSGTLPPIQIDDMEKIEEQKRWLDNEVEKVVEQRRQVEELEEILKKREEIVSKKEAILNEKSELEMKKLRSSQVVNKNILTVSSKLDTVDRMIDEKSRELAHTPLEDQQRIKEELGLLQGNRDTLQKKRGVLEEKLQEGRLMSPQDERRLIELDEAIEALDAAIEYKNDHINSKQLELRHSQVLSQSEDSVMNRLKALSAVETKTLLSKYFEKVVNLREKERKTDVQCSEMEVKLDEQEQLIRELEGALQRAAVEVDRRLTKQQREYEQKMQLLMQQITTSSTAVEDQPVMETTETKIHRLEKDLYFYKKTSRDLKRKLRDLYASGVIKSHDDVGLNSLQSSVDDQELPPMSNNHSHIPSSLNREREIRPLSGRSEGHGSRPSSARNAVVTHTSITPVKISRNNLRLMTEKEVSVRRSNLSTSQQSVGSPPPPQDSLDPGGGNNPWG
ncbi:kinesin-like protein KIF27 isoform X2 [Saccostrea echinata]|uniref:kinesin-like protein KIF27 isoform X2 n=1 Tax=Saccostrea echinata TaxID=191078 RepID=UPI002A827094|nr:kinesin-like protein KIF27 isoform X2 [Saccostrea echinata]